MTAYYRNKTTGKIQSHPKSGLGASFNSDEVGLDGKPVKPRTSLAPSKDELKSAKSLMKTPEATTGTGSAKKQEGDQ